jgi:hypothetical protein
MAALGTYNSITLAINTPVQITPPGTGDYVLVLLNTTTGNLFISNTNGVGANATSFKVPTNLYSPTLSASSTIWIACDVAGTISAYCTPAS